MVIDIGNSANTIDFGRVQPNGGSYSTSAFTIKNTGSANLTVSLHPNAGYFSEKQIVIEPGGEQSVDVRWETDNFWQGRASTYYGSFALQSNDVNNNYVLIPWCAEIVYYY